MEKIISGMSSYITFAGFPISPCLPCRYVLKNKDSDEVLFVVVFTLLKKVDVGKDEASGKVGNEPNKVDKMEEDKDKSRHEGEKSFEPEAGDLD